MKITLMLLAFVIATQATTLPDCENEPPICAGGLLPQTATAADMNNYVATYNTDGCRYMQPPRCPLHYKRSCRQECTP